MTSTKNKYTPFVKKTSSNGYRRAISPEALSPGATVSSEKSFSSVLFQSHARDYCAHCLSKFDSSSSSSSSSSSDDNKRGRRCAGGCENTYYCGRECQRRDRSVHKHTCKKYATIVGGALRLYESCVPAGGGGGGLPFPMENFLLARKVYVELCLSSGTAVKDERADVPPPSWGDDLGALSEGPPGVVPDDVYDEALSTVLAVSFGTGKKKATVAFFRKMLKKFEFNNFGIQNALQTVIAHGVFPRGAVLNHSCDPNCVLTYAGSPSRQIIRTIKHVNEGDELFHSYTDVCRPTAVRRARLSETYGFSCDCGRCRGEGRWGEVDVALTEGVLSDDDAYRIARLIGSAERISVDSNDDDDGDALVREYDALRGALSIQRKALGRYNLERYKTEGLAMNVAMLLDGKDVLAHAEASVDFLAFVCNRYHPLLLLKQMTLSELYDMHGEPDRARLMYKELVDACKIVWGEDHEFVHHYKTLLSRQ